MTKKREYILPITVLFLILTGLLMIMSSSYNSKTHDFYIVVKQIIFIFAGIIGIVILSKININYIKKYSFILYIIINIMLLIVLFMPKVNGASSWFNFGFFSIQPSEFAKLIIILFVAKLLDEKGKFTYLKVIGYSIIPIFLIYKQPDFGTDIVVIGILTIMIFFSGIKYRYVIPVVLTFIIAMILIIYNLNIGNNLFFSEYQADRIRVFLNPDLDPYGSGYNVLKAKQAIGSGELLGMGYFEGLQNQLGNIPEKTTDFIFAVIGEELGFIFCVFIVFLFSVLFIRILLIAKNTESNYKKLIIVGVFSMLFIHVFINIGMNIGLVPVTGIPLPFISYGGSSIFINLIAIGFVLHS